MRQTLKLENNKQYTPLRQTLKLENNLQYTVYTLETNPKIRK